MVYKCVVPNCGVIYANASKIKLYRFPTDEVLKSKWMKSCSITKHLVSYKVCDNHFLPEDIKDNGRLMPSAVPSIQLGVNLHPNSENSSQIDINTNNNSKPNGADSPQRSDEVLKSKWMKNCSNTKHLVSYKVCDNHFLPEDIKDNGRRLMPFAVPSIQLGVNLHPNSENSSQIDISTINNSKPNGADSPQRSDTSTSLITNISPTQTSKKRKFSLKYPRYFNDLTVEHFSTPIRAKIHLAFAKQKHNDVRKKLKKVQQQNRRLAEKLKCINVSKQEDSNHLTENASQLI